MSLLQSSPPPEALCAEPFSVSELDAHPDAVRLWATVCHVREEAGRDAEEDAQEMQSRVDRAEERAEDMADELSGIREKLEEVEQTIRDALSALNRIAKVTP